MNERIGFIGLGIMGEPMARNLLAGGVELTVYNRTAAKADGLHTAGAKVASSPQEVAREAGTVILMLTGPEAIDASLWGENGLLTVTGRCSTVVNMSSVSPAYTRELNAKLEEQGVLLVDAPVSGSKKPAEDAGLVILAGGPEEKIAELEPLLLKMGKKVVYCGAVGSGSGMKMFINLLLCTMLSGLSEALTLGEKCGLSMEAMLETVLAGPLGCGLFQMKADMFKTGEYPTQFPFKHMYKDLNFILATAEENGMNAQIARVLRDLYAKGMEKGLADLDFTAIKKVVEKE